MTNEIQEDLNRSGPMNLPQNCLVDDLASEWTYVKRRTMQEIVPGLYLGPYSSASKSKLEVLLNNGITHIICIRQDIESHIIRPQFRDRFKYLVLDIADTTTENIIRHFPSVCLFIDEALGSEGRCLVHGNAGISRSAALVMAYIMQKFELSARDAFIFVQQRRFCINPNDGFMAQLIEFEPIYRAQQIRTNGQSSTENNRNKRSIDDVQDSFRSFQTDEFETTDVNKRRVDKGSDDMWQTPQTSALTPRYYFRGGCNADLKILGLPPVPPASVEPMDHDIS